MTGRPVSTGSVVDADGGVRAYLHVTRLRRLAERIGGKEAALLLAAAEAMQHLARRNQQMGRIVGRTVNRPDPLRRGLSLAPADAAEKLAELAADAPVVAYLGRGARVRAIRHGRVPRGAKRIGRYDISSDYRDIARDVQRVLQARTA